MSCETCAHYESVEAMLKRTHTGMWAALEPWRRPQPRGWCRKASGFVYMLQKCDWFEEMGAGKETGNKAGTLGRFSTHLSPPRARRRER